MYLPDIFAEPRPAGSKTGDPDFWQPRQRYKFDPAKGKALLAEAGYTPAKPLSFKALISNSGSGQMLPLPMNEFLQAKPQGGLRCDRGIRRDRNGRFF